MNSLNRRNFLTTAAALGTFTLFGTAPIAHAAARPRPPVRSETFSR